MTILSILAPVVAAAALATAVTALHRRLPPAFASRVVAATIVAVIGAAVPTLWLLSLAFLAHTPLLGNGFEWCARLLGVHRSVPAFIGPPALLLAVIGTARAVRSVRASRRIRHDGPGSVEVAGHDRPFAFTLPGRGGHIVLSSGLVELLDDGERAVVVAHERAHPRHRHDRFVLVANVAAAALPLLRPLASRLSFSLERWADEAAVAHCGDRHFVARTLGKVALSHPTPVGAPTFAGLGVTARVASLLAPPKERPRRPLVLGLWSSIGGTAALSVMQLQQIAGLAGAICPH